MALLRCPDCGRDVSDVAPACPGCGRPFGQVSPVVATQGEGLGYVILLLPLASTALLWIWIGPMNRLQDPVTHLSVIAFATVLVSAVLISTEASALGMGKLVDAKGQPGNGPITWFFATVMFWVIAFPAYLHHRHNYGRKSLVVGGVLGTLVFAASLALFAEALSR